MYFSFTTRFIVTDDNGQITGSIDKIHGHLGAMTFDAAKRKVYASLECKDDEIGANISQKMGVDAYKESSFYIVEIDVDAVNRLGVSQETAMRRIPVTQANEDYKAEVTTQKEKSAREAEARRILKDMKIPEKHFDKIIKYSGDEIAQLKIDGEGNVTGAEAFKAVIDKDWADYKTEEGKLGAKTATPPTITGKGKAYSSKDEIMAIKDTTERQAAIANNPELFNM